jgi:SAM-dependent methyltransferase
VYSLSGNVLDLAAETVSDQATADHYTKQWGAALGIGDFLKSDAQAASVTPGKQLGWLELFERIRSRARRQRTLVYDAACGFGGVFADLFASPMPPELEYVGADIHRSLADIRHPDEVPLDRARFVRWDISLPLPTHARFDYVICRAAIHHTAAPRTTFASLCAVLAPGGTLAITAYAKKAPMREAIDDLFRMQIGALRPEQALIACKQFTALGKALQAVEGMLIIESDLPLLGIKRGRYGVQEFVYDHFIKCWFNTAFGDRYSDVVNYDWYHPTYAYRYELDELIGWYEQQGLRVVRKMSIKAQHYVEGIAA